MLRCITARQLEEWKAFWELEPFGDEWRQVGVLACATQQAMAGRSYKGKPEWFMPAVRSVAKSAGEVWNQLDGFFRQKKAKQDGTRGRN